MAPISSCSAACIHCNLDGYASRTNRFDTGGTPPPGFCTQIVHHIQYVGFVAGSPSLTIEVTVAACVGVGMELGIYQTDDCGAFTLVSNCHTYMIPGTYVFSTNTTLDVGCHYYLVMDGNLPSDCDFSIRVLAGSTIAPPVTFNGPVVGPMHVCAGEEANYIVNHNGACYQQWNVTGGSIVGDDMEDDVTVVFDIPGRAMVCFIGENLCNPPDEICKEVIVHPNPVEVLVGPYEICEDEVYMYNGIPYRGGTHTIPHTTAYGCDSFEVLEIEVVEHYRDILNKSVCFPDCFTRAGQTFCIPGIHVLTIQSESPPFCDTVYNLNLNSLNIEAVLHKSGNLSCGDTAVIISSDSSSILGKGVIRYRWIDGFGDKIGEEQNIEVTEPGRYCLEISIEGSDGTECFKTICTNVIEIAEDPSLAIDSTIVICKNDTLFLNQIPVYEENGYQGRITYHTGPPDTSNRINDYIIVQDTVSLWAKFIAGRCGDELPFNIEPSPTPEILVTDTLTFCEGDTINLASVNVTDINGLRGQITFHSSKPPDSNNFIGPRLVLMNGDRVFVKSDLNQCYDVTEVNINILDIPVASFRLSEDTVCVGDTVQVIFTGDLDNAFQYSWNWSGANAVSTGDQNYSVISNSPGSLNLSVSVDNGFCTSPPFGQLLTIETPLEPIILNCEQTDTVITITWPSQSNADGYIIDDLTGLGVGTRINDTTYRIAGLNNGDVVKIMVTAYGPESCGPVSDMIECKAIYCPPRLFEIDTVPFICLDSTSQSIALLAMIEGGFAGGSLFWFGAGISDSLSSAFDPRLAGVGRHLIECRFEKDDCVWTTALSIEVRPTPVAKFESDTSVCRDSAISIDFIGQGGVNAVATWDYDGGFAMPGVDRFDVELVWTTSGEKILELILTENGCISEPFLAVVSVDPPLDSLDFNCIAQRTGLTISFGNLTNADRYVINVLSGQSISVFADTQIVVANLTPGEEVVIEVTAISSNACADLVQTIRCTTLDCPTLSFELQREIDLCDNHLGSTYLMDFQLPGRGSTGQFHWAGPSLLDTVAGLIDLTTLSLGSHKYVVAYEEEGCSYKDSVVLTLHSAPQIELGPDLLITCDDSIHGIRIEQGINEILSWSPEPTKLIGDSAVFTMQGRYTLTVVDTVSGCMTSDDLLIELESDVPTQMDVGIQNIGCDSLAKLGSLEVLSVNGGKPPHLYSLDGVSYKADGLFTGLPPGIYDVFVKDSNGCVLSVKREIVKALPVSVDLGPDIEINEGQLIQLEAVVSKQVVQISWFPNDELSCSDCLFPAINPDSTVTLTIIVIDKDGCRATDEIIITVKYKRVFIPNIFSPNGDQLNDILTVFTTEEIEVIEYFTVYDRWGEIVYNAQNIPPNQQNIGWDGYMNGEKMNTGVYIATVRVLYKDGSREDFTTDVTLLQ